MKNFRISVSVIIALLLVQSLFSQDQRTLFEEWGETELTCVKIKSLAGEPYIFSDCNSAAIYKLSLHDLNDPYLWYMKIGNQFKGQYKNYYSSPEQKPHPTFLSAGTEWGDESIKYYRSFEYRGRENAALIAGDFLYEITRLNKGEWQINKLYLKGKYKPMQFKKIKAAQKKIKETDHYKKINEYLAKEKSVLDTKTASYKTQHSDYFATFNQEDSKANQAVKDSKRIVYEQLVGSVVQVYNDKGYNIKIAVGKNASGSILKSGEMRRYECNLADLYLVGASGSKSFLIKPKDHCGKQYHIN